MQATPASRVDRTPAWAFAAVGVATAVLAWLRLSPTTRATLWAEDGREFLGDRLREGPLQSWLDVYAGYLHAVPRAMADAVVSFLPVDRYALGMAALSCAVVGLVAALVVRCSADVVQWLPGRVALGLATALLPAVPVEVLGNAANVHWAFLWLAPWLLLASPRSDREAVGLGGIGLVAALTELQVAWFLPLVLHRWSDRRRWWVRGGVLLGLVAQGVATLVAPRGDENDGGWGLRSIAEGYVVDAVASTWTGSAEVVGDLVRGHGLLPLLLTVVPFAAALVLVLRRGVREERLAAVALALGSVVVWAAAAIVNPWEGLGYPGYTAARWQSFALVRYGVVPALFLFALVVLAAATLRREGRRLPAWALLGALGLAAVLSFDVPQRTRDDGPRWEDEVEGARERCATAAPDTEIDVPVAPEGWWVDLRCSQLGDP
ncbi:MAG TPA: hypothetical protein VJ804_07985 [Acidimicrobiales bacterium]|nr:hypothetical protein [Acidimicrobiales bacterium]